MTRERDIAATADDGLADGTGNEHRRQTSAISSGPFEISRASFSSPPEGPPQAVLSNAMERGKPLVPLSRIVGIGCGIFVVLVGLALLLFR